MTMGQLIKAARERAGMTQEELGKKIGVTGVAIMRYEKGQRQPRLAQLQAIAAALGVGVAQLMPPDNYWEDTDGNGHTEPMEPPAATPKDRIDAALDQLNDEGQEKATERVEELTEIPKYQRQKAAPKMARCPQCGMMVRVSPGSRKALCPSCRIHFDVA